MGHSIAVMNTKGGVGKSTVVMAIAETLSTFYRQNVLVIDSDSQTSMSIMLMPMDRWEQIEREKKTLVDYLGNVVLGKDDADWKEFVATQVSDVEEADTIYLIPSHMELSLFEREVTAAGKQDELNAKVRALLEDAKRYFDIVLIDCPPGISILTESWLRECDFHLPPVKPDYLSVRGYGILKRFKDLSPDKRMSENIGLLVNMRDNRLRSEEEWHNRLAADPANRCFSGWIPRRAYIQRAADFDPATRTYAAKYPGDAGQTVKHVVQELLARLQAAQQAQKASAADAAPTTASASAPPANGTAPAAGAAQPPRSALTHPTAATAAPPKAAE